MQVQTVFRAGNSSVVAIPSDLLREMKIETGQKVAVEKTSPEEFVVRKISNGKPQNLTPDREFKRWWRAFLKDNSEILDELAIC